MEVETENDTTRIEISQTTSTYFGRGLGFNTADKTVSRRHLSFRPQSKNKNNVVEGSGGSTVQFKVIGKNPVWLKRIGGNGHVTVLKRGDEGVLEIGDLFCVSGKKTVWCKLKRRGIDDDVLKRLECSGDDVDISDIDPVKEFGFLVMGNEFNTHSKQMISNMKKWEWFLEEPNKESDDEGTSENKRKARKRKKKTRSIDDDEWTGECEDGKELVSQSRKTQRPNYSTRSKKPNIKSIQNSKSGKSSGQNRSICSKEVDEDEDEEGDGTLGGFIMDEEEVEQEENYEDEEEEEEFEYDELND